MIMQLGEVDPMKLFIHHDIITHRLIISPHTIPLSYRTRTPAKRRCEVSVYVTVLLMSR